MVGFLPENPGVIEVDVIAAIRRRFHVENEAITSLSNAINLSRQTIRKHLKMVEKPVYQWQG
jgi:response regulator of citrate/malate metabolism